MKFHAVRAVFAELPPRGLEGIRLRMTEAPTNRGSTTPPANGRVEALEQRVHQLEGAVAALQDTRQLEERLVERVAERMGRDMPPVGLMIEARRSRLPAAVAQPSVPPQDTSAAQASPWLLLDVYHEVRSIFRMFIDPRYRVSRGVWPLTIGLLVAIGTSWLWVPASSLPVFGALLTRAVDLVLAYILFKVL